MTEAGGIEIEMEQRHDPSKNDVQQMPTRLKEGVFYLAPSVIAAALTFGCVPCPTT
jgi:hypothetical protein